jgi:hypothetical protein
VNVIITEVLVNGVLMDLQLMQQQENVSVVQFLIVINFNQIFFALIVNLAINLIQLILLVLHIALLKIVINVRLIIVFSVSLDLISQTQ